MTIFSFVGRLGGPTKGNTMIGTILIRCKSCGQLSYDPRTETCDAE